MSRATRIFDHILGLARTVRSAGRAASAVENGRTPRPGDLHRLGISPSAFRAIQR